MAKSFSAESVEDSNAFIQKLNDEYTNPSGEDKSELPVEEQAAENSKQGDRGQTEPDNAVRRVTGPIIPKN